jgi:hypothetical protein
MTISVVYRSMYKVVYSKKAPLARSLLRLMPDASGLLPYNIYTQRDSVDLLLLGYGKENVAPRHLELPVPPFTVRSARPTPLQSARQYATSTSSVVACRTIAASCSSFYGIYARYVLLTLFFVDGTCAHMPRTQG